MFFVWEMGLKKGIDVGVVHGGLHREVTRLFPNPIPTVSGDCLVALPAKDSYKGSTGQGWLCLAVHTWLCALRS